MESAKNQVLATPALRTKFEIASSFLAEALDNKVSFSATNRKTRIASLNSKRGQGSSKTNGKNTNAQCSQQNKNTITDRFYTPQEWVKISAEEKQKVRDLRALRDKKRGVALVQTEEVTK